MYVCLCACLTITMLSLSSDYFFFLFLFLFSVFFPKNKQIYPSKNKQRQPAEIIGHNEDLMTKISVYLPVKSILRFRSVSKQWHSLLTHPQFILSYAASPLRISMVFFRRNNDPLCQLNGNNDPEIANFGYVRIPKEDTLYTLDSCNGLLLFKFLDHRSAGLHIMSWRFYVCNPSTRKYSELSLPEYIVSPRQLLYCYARLAFDPYASPYYKVIFFWVDTCGPSDLRISIYSSDTKTCRLLDCTLENLDPLNYAVFFKGAFFWSNYLFSKSGSSYFDINQESIKKVPPYSGPPSTKDFVEYFGRGGRGGHLYLILGDMRDAVDLDVYVLKEDFSCWVAKYKIHFDDIVVHQYFRGGNNWDDGRYYIPCVLDTKGKEEARIVVFANNQLLAYNFIDNTMKKLCNIPFPPGDDYIYRAMVIDCTESLSSV